MATLHPEADIGGSPHPQSDTSGEVLAAQRTLSGWNAGIVYGAAILMSLFHLWVNTIGVMPEIRRNAIHFGFVLFLGYILYPGSQKRIARSPKLN